MNEPGQCRARAAGSEGALAAGGGQPGPRLQRGSALARAAARCAAAPHPAAARTPP